MKYSPTSTHRTILLPLIAVILLTACVDNQTGTKAVELTETSIADIVPEPVQPQVALDEALEASLCQAFRELAPRAGLSEPCRVEDLTDGFSVNFPSKTITVPILTHPIYNELNASTVGSDSVIVNGGYTNTSALVVVSDVTESTCLSFDYYAPDGFSDSFTLKTYPDSEQSVVILNVHGEKTLHQIALPESTLITPSVLAISPREPNLILRSIGLQTCKS
ncbi:MAG: hypothetical protein ABJN22_14540 [Litorimonas sp.]